jgi:membrane-associated phospholipid phosphatase
VNSNLKKILFWQPKKDYLVIFDHGFWGEFYLIFFNYLIWVFFFFLSYRLIRFDVNFFGRLFIATFVAELIERYLKKKCLWPRPMFHLRDTAPKGLVNNWYDSGSFPSGHIMKTTYFFLFLLSATVFPIPIFLLITIPLLSFRVLVGFHYPTDMIGGILFGLIIWLLTKNLIFPDHFNYFIKLIFNFIFFIK